MPLGRVCVAGLRFWAVELFAASFGADDSIMGGAGMENIVVSVGRDRLGISAEAISGQGAPDKQQVDHAAPRLTISDMYERVSTAGVKSQRKGAASLASLPLKLNGAVGRDVGESGLQQHGDDIDVNNPQVPANSIGRASGSQNSIQSLDTETTSEATNSSVAVRHIEENHSQERHVLATVDAETGGIRVKEMASASKRLVGGRLQDMDASSLNPSTDLTDFANASDVYGHGLWIRKTREILGMEGADEPVQDADEPVQVSTKRHFVRQSIVQPQAWQTEAPLALKQLLKQEPTTTAPVVESTTLLPLSTTPTAPVVATNEEEESEESGVSFLLILILALFLSAIILSFLVYFCLPHGENVASSPPNPAFASMATSRSSVRPKQEAGRASVHKSFRGKKPTDS